jgi:hypothetical protein
VEAETASAGSPFNLKLFGMFPLSRITHHLKIEAKEEILPLNHPFRISRGSRTEAVCRNSQY